MSSFPRDIFLAEVKAQGKSEAYINNTLAYIDYLERKNLPVIFSIPHLALETEIEAKDLYNLIQNRNENYSFFLLRKKNKKNAPREIMAPQEELKFLQKWININILQRNYFNDHIHGFTPNSSILKHAKVHKNANFLLKIDLLKFFDTITEKQVYYLFSDMGYVKNLAWDLAKICTANHRESYWNSFNDQDKIKFTNFDKNMAVLPQGAPTSPLIANLIASKLDLRISKLSQKIGFKYTRYADDLCFSADKKEQIPSIKEIERIIEEEGFFVNSDKNKFSKKGMKQYVTGLSISNDKKVSLSKNKRREIFTHLHFLVRYGHENHLNKIKKKGGQIRNFQNWLIGHISFHYSIDKEIGKKMFDQYNKINWDLDIKINE